MTTLSILFAVIVIAAVIFSTLKGVLDLCIKYFKKYQFIKGQNEQLIKVIHSLNANPLNWSKNE